MQPRTREARAGTGVKTVVAGRIPSPTLRALDTQWVAPA